MLTTDVPTALALPENLIVQSIEQSSTTLTITAMSWALNDVDISDNIVHLVYLYFLFS